MPHCADVCVFRAVFSFLCLRLRHLSFDSSTPRLSLGAIKFGFYSCRNIYIYTYRESCHFELRSAGQCQILKYRSTCSFNCVIPPDYKNAFTTFRLYYKYIIRNSSVFFFVRISLAVEGTIGSNFRFHRTEREYKLRHG